MKQSLMLIMLMLMVTFCLSLVAGEKSRLCFQQLNRAQTELDRIEAVDGFVATTGEIKVAREWVECGFDLLEKGETDRATVLAERVSLQLVLVRTIVLMGKIEAQVERTESDVGRLLEALASARARLDRLILMYKGADLTDAYPREEESHE